MRTGRVFLAGAVALGFCFALAGGASAQVPPPSSSTDFGMSNLREQFTVDSIGATPISCVSATSVPSDAYHVNAKLKNVGGDMTQDLTNNQIVMGFAPSCASSSAVNAFVIPAGAIRVTTASNNVVQASFKASVPDELLGVFGTLGVNIMYNPTKGMIGFGPGTGLTAGSGTIAVNGSADLCAVATPAGPATVCFFMDLSTGPGESPDVGDADVDTACVCATPTISTLGFDFGSFIP